LSKTFVSKSNNLPKWPERLKTLNTIFSTAPSPFAAKPYFLPLIIYKYKLLILSYDNFPESFLLTQLSMIFINYEA